MMNLIVKQDIQVGGGRYFKKQSNCTRGHRPDDDDYHDHDHDYHDYDYDDRDDHNDDDHHVDLDNDHDDHVHETERFHKSNAIKL